MNERISRRCFVGLGGVVSALAVAPELAVAQTNSAQRPTIHYEPLETAGRKAGARLGGAAFSEAEHFPPNDITIYGSVPVAMVMFDAELPKNTQLTMTINVHLSIRSGATYNDISTVTFQNSGSFEQVQDFPALPSLNAGEKAVMWLSFSVQDGVNGDYAQVYPTAGGMPGLSGAIGVGLKPFEHDGPANYAIVYLFGRTSLT